ncbi:MAG: formamidopyrimidine-DNA glycosylase, partial [Armatimonadetes bacterium]|nr:formamidopyrimidine-DNA glycosylase [Armatimonadota bacterium]
TVRSPEPARFARRLRGRTITGIRRRGKYLLIDLDGGLTLIVHLRMTGDLEVLPASRPVHRHTRVIFAFNGRHLRFADQRRLGHMDLIATVDVPRFPGLREMGVEPLDRGFTLRRFRGLLDGRRGSLKALLLRQDLVAGIGNIYADEILFQARLHPARRVEALDAARVRRLQAAIQRVMRQAVAGLSRYGRPIGEFLDSRRRGAPCPRCGGPVAAERIAGRRTCYCPRCQV